ncbi:MAG TPA: anti-sigma factor [Acidimicrobiales bacterium]|nr:anti-sigma factor [Acidimicrobiales bacterium]
MMTHDDASELLGAYALDAVDGPEHAELEAHLETCPRCRAELDGLREVAGALGNSVEPLPEGLWSQIASRLPEREEEGEAPPMPRLVPGGGPEAGGTAATSPFRTPSTPSTGARRRRRTVVTSLAAAAVAAAAVAVVLGIGLVRANNNVSNLQAQVARPSGTVAQALATPGHRVVDLTSASGGTVARAVVVPDGHGYLISSTLPSLGHGQTYQLWGIVGSQAISLGLLGPSPRQAGFTMAGDNRPSRLSITAEPAGGTIMPTSAVVATGTV